ncbi:unnamed protein product [Phytophthora fragariaefolia]|uniref:Unnamed protein product n=1 Tax=Phytophthora fragariaefolia TaxID=1490495 RepID=A0A9W6XHX9_9STRA|nr:unnamed protein product [Phytophthora fragariaefolia]
MLDAVALAAATPGDADEEEVTTAEFSVDLADGQTWAINFYECAAEGDLECLEEILESGRVGVNDVDVDGFTALMVAAAEGHRDVVRALLRRGADVGVRTHELRSTALHFAAKVGGRRSRQNSCFRRYANVYFIFYVFNYFLLMQNGDEEIVAALCEADTAMVDCWNVNADTPLIWACIEGRAEAVKVLLKHGADVNMLNQYGASTLLCAVMIGEDPEQDAESDKHRAEIVTVLLEKNGELVNFQDREGSTAMHLAASCGYLKCVKTLLTFGADITLRNAIGQTPLEEAQDSELRESGPCVEHLRGIWRQLEEEAAARMMAMLEMEEEADKNAVGATGAGNTTGGKKSKKKNKKAKRKAAKQQQQQLQQQDSEQEQNPVNSDNTPEKEATIEEHTSAEPDPDATTPSNSVPEVKGDDASLASSDEEDDASVRASCVSVIQSDDEEAEAKEAEVNKTQDVKDAEPDDATRSAGAWTTVGKKHRSPIAATSTKERSPPKQEKALLSTPTRRKSAVTSPLEPAAHPPRRKFNQRPSDARDRVLTGERRIQPQVTSSSTTKEVRAVAHASVRTQEERWEKSCGLISTGRTSRSIASSSILNPHALAFRSLGLSTMSANAASVSSSVTSISSSGLPFSSSSPWRPGFGSSTIGPYAVASSSTAGLHYSSAGRLTWKQQRASGNHQVACEARDRWVGKLRLSNENVAETLGYLACGLCGELVNDNLQCSGGASSRAGDNTSSACTQLYCASCLQSSTFRTADSTMFKCIRCHEAVAKESMTRNSLAQAQAAALGLSMSNSIANGAQDDLARYSMEDMQHALEVSDPRVSAADLRAFHMVPGTGLSTLSNGQLEVLESAHQLALAQIVEQRLANARALERLQMEEWLKMQRDVLQFTPR